ncbi:MAG: DUF86 domain-containing protein [Pyrobaculum sp.]
MRCLDVLQRISEARSAMDAAERIASRRFEELSDEELWALRYQLIVLVEALASMCMKLAKRRWGIIYSSYRECLTEVGRRLGVGCVETLKALVGLRNLLVHRYFQVDDKKVYESIRSDFTCVKQFVDAVEDNASCV